MLLRARLLRSIRNHSCRRSWQGVRFLALNITQSTHLEPREACPCSFILFTKTTIIYISLPLMVLRRVEPESIFQNTKKTRKSRLCVASLTASFESGGMTVRGSTKLNRRPHRSDQAHRTDAVKNRGSGTRTVQIREMEFNRNYFWQYVWISMSECASTNRSRRNLLLLQRR